MNIRVMIADDHSMIRQGLKQLIELESDIKVVAQAANGREAVDMYGSIIPDVVLMDINMPEMNGLEAIREITEKYQSSKIVVLTIHNDGDYLLKAMQHGAMGYILKDSDSKVLIEAIRSAANGQSYIQPNMARILVDEISRPRSKNNTTNTALALLTDREVEVLKLLSKGMLNKEIATELYISEKTVKNHVSSIFRKLEVSDRTQAAVFAIKNKLVE